VRSGTKGETICFEAWPGEVVILSGTEPIQGSFSVHKGRIYKTKVREVFDQLFVDGRMDIEARLRTSEPANPALNADCPDAITHFGFPLH